MSFLTRSRGRPAAGPGEWCCPSPPPPSPVLAPLRPWPAPGRPDQFQGTTKSPPRIEWEGLSVRRRAEAQRKHDGLGRRWPDRTTCRLTCTDVRWPAPVHGRCDPGQGLQGRGRGFESLSAHPSPPGPSLAARLLVVVLRLIDGPRLTPTHRRRGGRPCAGRPPGQDGEHVRVDVQGQRDARVVDDLHDHAGRHALGQEQRGTRVAKACGRNRWTPRRFALPFRSTPSATHSSPTSARRHTEVRLQRRFPGRSHGRRGDRAGW
jgi:hypothetical protein